MEKEPNKNILERYAKLYINSLLDPSDKLFKNELKYCTAEILLRMNNNFDLSLKNLIVDEEIIINNNLNVIKNKLFSELLLKESDFKSDKVNLFIAIDDSGSMGLFEKYLAKVFFKWIEEAMKLKYNKINKIFVGFDTDAKIITELEAFNYSKSGGTILSTALSVINDSIIKNNYKQEKNHVIIISDGDNLTSDNQVSLRYISDIEEKVESICYFEINQYNRSSTIKSALKHYTSEKLKIIVIAEKDGMLDALKSYFNNDEGCENYEF